MIRVSFAHLTMIYLVLMLAPVAAAWVIDEKRRGSRERDAMRNTVRCSLCGFMFRHAGEGALAQCPSCGAQNEKRAISEV